MERINQKKKVFKPFIQLDETTIHIGGFVKLNEEKIIENGRGKFLDLYRAINPKIVHCIQVQYFDFANQLNVICIVGNNGEDGNDYCFESNELIPIEKKGNKMTEETETSKPTEEEEFETDDEDKENDDEDEDDKSFDWSMFLFYILIIGLIGCLIFGIIGGLPYFLESLTHLANQEWLMANMQGVSLLMLIVIFAVVIYFLGESRGNQSCNQYYRRRRRW